MSGFELTEMIQAFVALPTGCALLSGISVGVIIILIAIINEQTKELKPYRERAAREEAERVEAERQLEIRMAAEQLINEYGLEKPKRVALTDDGELVEAVGEINE